MTDKEKVITGLIQCVHYNGSCADCPYDGPNCRNNVLDDAIKLLKEPETIVRCRDCQHGKPGACGCGVDCDGVWHDDDWFCADGEGRLNE